MPTNKKGKYASGVSGAHKNPRFPMSGTEEQIASWDRAAARAGTTRTAWLRELADEAAARSDLRAGVAPVPSPPAAKEITVEELNSLARTSARG